MPPRKSAATKREHAPEKRRRAAANRKAKEVACKYVIPAIVILFVAIAIFFCAKYGCGKKIVSRINKAVGRK